MQIIFYFIICLITLLLIYSLIQPKTGSKEYILNKYLKLKLENGQTNIYVNNKLFRQCIYLLLNIKTENLEDFEEVDSIDEAAEKLDGSMERDFSIKNKIGSDTEFWGHCSNLQAWVENDYDTRILHRNLAFPLLKRLVEVGDPKAKKVFKDEIALRVASKHPTVINYLIQEGFLTFLSPDELETIFSDIELTHFKRPLEELIRILSYSENIPNGRITRLFNQIFNKFDIKHIPLIFSKLKSQIPENLKEIVVKLLFETYGSRPRFPKIEFINNNIQYFDLKDFNLLKYENRIVGIKPKTKLILKNQNLVNISKIKGLEDIYEEIIEIDLSNNLLKDLEGIGRFINVKILNLNNNRLTNINELQKLKQIKVLSLRKNKISKLDFSLSFPNLKCIDLSENVQIQEIPSTLLKFPSLECIRLWECNIKSFDKSVERFFWDHQNYRYFKGFNQDDINYYEETHKKEACSQKDGGLYKDFVRWVLRMRTLMKESNFSYKEIYKFENRDQINAIWGGRITNAFEKWLFDKNQMKITDYF